MGNFLTVLRNRNLALLLLGRVISLGGDWLFRIALSVAVFQYSHGKSLYIGLLWIAMIVPSILLGPFSGSLADRIGYRPAMILTDLGQMVVVGGLAAALHPSTWVVVYPLVLVAFALDSVFDPASVAIVPLLLRNPDEQLAANATLMQAKSLAIIAGAAAGGIVAGMGQINLLLFIDAGTFAVSALCVYLVKPRPAEAVSPQAEDAPEEIEEGFIAGLRSLARRPALTFSATVMAIPEFVSGAMVVWLVPYSIQALHLGNQGVGYLYACIGVGYLIGGFVASAFGSSIRLDVFLATAVAVTGTFTVIFGVWHNIVVALCAIFGIGLAEVMQYAAYRTLLQQAVPENAVGRASGTMGSLLSNMMLLGTALAGVLAGTLGLTVSIAGMGVLILLGAVVGWINLQRKTQGQPDAASLARIPAFATVSPAVREWAVRRMAREQIPGGAIIFRQGAEGDHFYIIAKGRVRIEATSDGRVMTRELGAGDFFGEIALLKNVPRTATVQALEPVVLWTMTRQDFEDLQERAAEFKESLWETATARLEASTTFAVA